VEDKRMTIDREWKILGAMSGVFVLACYLPPASSTPGSGVIGETSLRGDRT